MAYKNLCKQKQKKTYPDTAIQCRMKGEHRDSELLVDLAVQGWGWDSLDRDLSRMREAEREIMLQDSEAGQVD